LRVELLRTVEEAEELKQLVLVFVSDTYACVYHGDFKEAALLLLQLRRIFKLEW